MRITAVRQVGDVLFFFFFQAEDGIRDVAVTGVQTCALPIYARQPRPGIPGGPGRARSRRGIPRVPRPEPAGPRELLAQLRARPRVTARREIGRASCRERV